MRRPGLLDAIFRVGTGALGAYRQGEAAEAEASLAATERTERKRERWREMDIQNATLAERQRSAIAGETLRTREIADRRAMSAAEEERRENEARALAEYRSGQLDLGRQRNAVAARRAATAGSSAERPVRPTYNQAKLQELVDLYTKPISQGGLGMSLEAANRRARLRMGMSPGLDLYDILDAEEMRREQGRAAGATLPAAPGTGNIDLRRP